MLDLIEKSDLMPRVKWDVIIDSSVVKMIKPNEEIFLLAQKKAKVKHNEILFVENSKKHVEAVNKLDWQTFLYDSSNHETSCIELAKFLI